MPEDRIGQRYQLYLGVIVENTTFKNQRWFHIYCPELLPSLSNDVTKEAIIEEIDIYNVLTNQQEKTKVNIATTIHAEYRGLDTSKSVPTMWRGQQVLVFNYANTDKYYWLPLEKNDSVRRREHIRWSAANQDMTTKELTDNNTYFLEIDTKYRKHVWLHLASSDGEKFGYDFKIDAETHVIELYDTPSAGGPTNTIRLDSDIPRISLQNSVGTSIVMNNINLEVNVPGDMIVNVSKDVRINVKGNWFKNIIGNVRRIITGNYTTSLIGNWLNNIVGTQTHDMIGTRNTVLHTNDHKHVYALNEEILGDRKVNVVGAFTPDHTKKISLGDYNRTIANSFNDVITLDRTSTYGGAFVLTSTGFIQHAAAATISYAVFGSLLTIVIPSPIGEATCVLKRITGVV